MIEESGEHLVVIPCDVEVRSPNMITNQQTDLHFTTMMSDRHANQYGEAMAVK